MTSTIPPGFELIDVGPGFSATFGPVYIRRADTTLGFRVTERHVNPVAMCHGGALATIIDMSIAAVRSGPGTAAGHLPTISMHVDYLAPSPLGAWVEAAVTLVKTTRTMIFTQTLVTADGTLVARAMGIYRNYEPK
jgi:uncharacterized protein (TIGR00369 family)